MGAQEIFGRGTELDAVHAFIDGNPLPVGLVLVGKAGIGKTMLWEAGVAAARERGMQILSARANQAETQLSFTGLVDLLDGVDTTALGLPAPQEHALAVALLRAEPAGAPPEAQAIALGLLSALRTLSARKPVLVAIDDVQWLDPPSAEALAFALRRLEEAHVRLLFARRPGPASGLEQELMRRGAEQLEIGPLSLGGVRRLLSQRLRLSLPRWVLHRIFEITGGNPLFALELGRTLAERGVPKLGEDIPVPAVVEDLLGVRVAALRPSLRRTLLALSLGGDLRTAQLAAVAGRNAVDDAVAEELVLLEGDRVRCSHPLLAAVAKEHADATERRAVHRELAEAIKDPELSALHRALAAEAPDRGLSATLSAAAANASARGARQQAVELADHALRLTPPGSADRTERVLALAWHFEAAGERQQVVDLLSPELASLPRGNARVRALLLLSEGSYHDNHEHEHFLERALAESADDAVARAHVLAKMAINATACCAGQAGEAEAWALEALAAAPAAGPDVERLALHGLAWARCLSGRPVEDVCERFRTASDAPFHITDSPEQVAALRLAWRGNVAEARGRLRELLALSDERGEAVSYALQRMNLCDIELRTGGWQDASRLLDEWSAAGDGLLIVETYERSRALLAAGRGLAEEAERWSDSAFAGSEPHGYRWQALEALRARGIASLLNHQPARAAEALGAVWEHTRREGVEEPGAFPVAPDLVEALVELGELDQARAVADRLRGAAEAQEHPWGYASTQRCEALVRLASGGYDEKAAALMVQSADTYAGLGFRFDRPRTLLALGRVQRRLRKWGAARTSLEDAAAAFDDLDSPGWAEAARSELARVGARRPRAPGDLTEAERRVAELAAEGLSNKQIASNLFVTVRTVEVHLKHTYAKLGIRSRTQLAGRLSHSAPG